MSANIYQKIFRAIKQQLETLLVPAKPNLVPIRARLDETKHRSLR